MQFAEPSLSLRPSAELDANNISLRTQPAEPSLSLRPSAELDANSISLRMQLAEPTMINLSLRTQVAEPSTNNLSLRTQAAEPPLSLRMQRAEPDENNQLKGRQTTLTFKQFSYITYALIGLIVTFITTHCTSLHAFQFQSSDAKSP